MRPLSPRQVAIQRAREKEEGRKRWMRDFEERALALGGPPGRLDWAEAGYLYGKGIGPFDAAQRIYGASPSDQTRDVARPRKGSRFAGHVPVLEAYRYAPSPRRGPSLTRFEYATLAEMARRNGDLSFVDVGRRATRLRRLEQRGLVRRNAQLRRWELRGDGWNIVNAAESNYRLASDS